MTQPHHISMMFHPTQAVPDLGEARDWFARVFQRYQVTWADRWDFSKINPDYPRDYSFFVHIADVVHDVLCPPLMTFRKVSPDSVHPHLEGMGWWTEGIDELTRVLLEAGFDPLDQYGKPATPGQLPQSRLAADCYIIFTNHAQKGLRVEFAQWGEQHLEFYSRKGDPRLQPGWKLPPVDPQDPLAIERCSHHTILTADAGLGVRLYVDTLGGKVLAHQRNALFDADSILIEFAGSVLEYVTVPGSQLESTGGRDLYHGITFRVADIDRARRHLASQHVRMMVDSDSRVITDPASSLGVAWGFTSTSIV
jgi:catechol 2,3-dioxygenase-like lactoylglutathione lyase family enzyme